MFGNLYIFSILCFLITSIGTLYFQWHTTDGIFFAVIGFFLISYFKNKNFFIFILTGIFFGISALTKQRILKAVEVAMEVYNDRAKKIKTSKLNEVMLPVFEATPPPAIKGKYIKIKYCVQLPTPSPQFVFFCNLPQYVKEPYKRFTENQKAMDINCW